MESILIAYVIGLLLITVVFSFCVGLSGTKSGGDIGAIFCVSVTWPIAVIVIAYLCIVGGFVYLGERLKEKIQTDKNKDTPVIPLHPLPNVI